jgi:hypothetical protein
MNKQHVIITLLMFIQKSKSFINGVVNGASNAGAAGVSGTMSLGNSAYRGVTGVFSYPGDVDDYHSSDKDAIALKQRMLADADPKNPRPNGGIRARLKNETVEVPAAANDIVQLQKSVRELSAGSARFTPIFDGVTDQYPLILRSLREYRDSLEGNKTSIDNHIKNFEIENTASLFKALKENPNVAQKVFQKFNQGVSQMYHTLDRQIKAMNKETKSSGKKTMTTLKDIMISQNKTMKNYDSEMKSDDFSFRQKLNRKAVPDLITSQYIASADLARIRKTILDSVNNFNTNVLASIKSQADTYIDTQGTKVVDQSKKMIDKAASKLRRQMLVLQNEIDRQVRGMSKQIDKNITSLNKGLNTGTKSVESNRAAALRELSRTVDSAISVVNNFQRDVIGTSGDLSTMLTVGGSNMDSIENQDKLTREAIEGEFDEKQKTLSSSNLLTNSRGSIANGMTSLQGGISSTFAQGRSQTASMTSSLQSRISAGLSDSEDISSQISNQVSGVQSAQDQIVNGQLQTGIGLTTGRIADIRQGRVSAVSDFASNLQARIDSGEADNDEALSDTVSSAEKSTSNSQSSVMGRLAELNSRIAQNQDSIVQRHAGDRANWVKAMTASQSSLNDNAQSLSGMQTLIRSLQSGSLPALDNENEDRIGSALSQLTEIRRLGSSAGDSLQTNSVEFLNKLLGSVPSTTTSLSSASTSGLDKQVDNLKSVSRTYKQRIAEFESGMNKQLQDLNAKYTSVDKAVSTGPAAKAIGTIVAHEQSVLAQAGREAVRAIYNSSSPESVQGTIAQYVAKNPRFDIDRYLGYLLHDDTSTGFPAMYGLLSAKLTQLSSTSATAESGLSSLFDYFEKLKGSIAKKLSELPPSDLKTIEDLIAFRQSAVDEVDAGRANLNGTIVDKFRVINETIENKTSNFYKQFQTASIFADSLVQGFSDYIDKMIAFEKLTEEQRIANQASLIATIQANANATDVQAALKNLNSSEIDRINALVAQASDTSDQSAAGVERRRAANQALIDAMGTEVAEEMMQRYQGLQANSQALAQSLQKASDEYSSNREASIAAAQLGVNGINSQSVSFSNIADDTIGEQKARASELGKAIDSLLSNSTFLQNISATEFGKVLQSVQESDQLSYNQLSAYKASNGAQAATLEGVVRDFSVLMEQEINRTREFLDALSANFTDISKHTSVLSESAMGEILSNLSSVDGKVDGMKSTLNSDVLSIGPIQEGVEGRLSQLMENENKFAGNTQSQLRELVSRVESLNSDVAMARDEDMRRLRSALTQMSEDFRNKAIQMQSEKVVGGFIETKSSRDIKADLSERINVLRRYVGI